MNIWNTRIIEPNNKRNMNVSTFVSDVNIATKWTVDQKKNMYEGKWFWYAHLFA